MKNYNKTAKGLFNSNNLKNAFKKGLQIGVLGTALAANTMMFTNCTHDDGCSNGHYVGCPHWEKENEVDVKTAKLGNGNYTMTNFMVTDEGTVNEKINANLTKAESYIKGLVNEFSESLNDRPNTQAYFNDLITNVDKINFTRLLSSGFDTNITDLQDACRPVINDIYNNIDDIVNKTQFEIYYKALANEVYRYGFGGTYGKNNTQKNYQENIDDLVYDWNYMYSNNPSYSEPFVLKTDLENGCGKITEHMDNLIEQAATNMGNGITATDLRKVVNLSFNINSLDSMHDRYGDKQIYNEHKTCNPIENDPILGY